LHDPCYNFGGNLGVKPILLVHDYEWLPIGPGPIVIQMGIPRVECRKCATIRQVAVGFADERAATPELLHAMRWGFSGTGRFRMSPGI